ncbi:MAG: transcription termination/antitermination NusG family protein, partial [Planctomycetota bacterium]
MSEHALENAMNETPESAVTASNDAGESPPNPDDSQPKDEHESSSSDAKRELPPSVPDDSDPDRPFDPAVDLPMYRGGMDWFVLRVASNKESYVRETLMRKVQIEGLEHLVGRIMVPTEKTMTLKGGKQRVTETKLYPGYVFVEMKL